MKDACACGLALWPLPYAVRPALGPCPCLTERVRRYRAIFRPTCMALVSGGSRTRPSHRDVASPYQGTGCHPPLPRLGKSESSEQPSECPSGDVSNHRAFAVGHLRLGRRDETINGVINTNTGQTAQPVPRLSSDSVRCTWFDGWLGKD